jgi:DNA polymerase I-like protein with 3'-5' exonuclease and polymerase domains
MPSSAAILAFALVALTLVLTPGRLSSNEPNLQTIPVRTEDGRKIRKAFVATPGHTINARLQGSAADIIRRAMIRMDDALAAKRLSARMLLQVHDELVFEVPDEEVAATLPVVQHTMQDAPFPAVILPVPLQVDARAATNWDEAH